MNENDLTAKMLREGQAAPEKGRSINLLAVALLIIEVTWAALLIIGCIALVDVIKAHAATPYIDAATGKWVIEINTQEDAIEIFEAPPIGDTVGSVETQQRLNKPSTDTTLPSTGSINGTTFEAVQLYEAPLINRISEDLDTIDLNAQPKAIYDGITLTEYEGGLIERILWAEANNQSFDGQRAVVEVIFNRLRSPEWPDTIEGVLSQKGQFATWKSRNKVTPTEMQSDVISAVLRETETALPDTTYVYFDTKGVNGKEHVRIQDHVFGR